MDGWVITWSDRGKKMRTDSGSVQKKKKKNLEKFTFISDLKKKNTEKISTSVMNGACPVGYIVFVCHHAFLDLNMTHPSSLN